MQQIGKRSSLAERLNTEITRARRSTATTITRLRARAAERVLAGEIDAVRNRAESLIADAEALRAEALALRHEADAARDATLITRSAEWGPSDVEDEVVIDLDARFDRYIDVELDDDRARSWILGR